MKNVKEFEIDLTTSNDCQFLIDVLNETSVIGEIYSKYYDNADRLTCVIYTENSDQYEELLSKFPVFENIYFDEYDEDDCCILDEDVDVKAIKEELIADITELKNLYDKYDMFINKYAIDLPNK